MRLVFILLLLFFVFSNIASAGGKLIYAKGQVQVLSKGSKSKMFQKVKELLNVNGFINVNPIDIKLG